jgi:hypothetical protein
LVALDPYVIRDLRYPVPGRFECAACHSAFMGAEWLIRVIAIVFLDVYVIFSCL